MPTSQQEQHTEKAEQGHQQLNAGIGRHVLRTLGEPVNLLGVQVRPLWEGHYRVNVLVGADAASARVAHSYFLVADGRGNIAACTPEITRLY
jgi:hypothetical protein